MVIFTESVLCYELKETLFSRSISTKNKPIAAELNNKDIIVLLAKADTYKNKLRFGFWKQSSSSAALQAAHKKTKSFWNRIQLQKGSHKAIKLMVDVRWPSICMCAHTYVCVCVWAPLGLSVQSMSTTTSCHPWRAADRFEVQNAGSSLGAELQHQSAWAHFRSSTWAGEHLFGLAKSFIFLSERLVGAEATAPLDTPS